MSRHDEAEDDFLRIIDRIIDSKVLVIVEGRKDRTALKKLGIVNVIEIDKKPLFKVIEDVYMKNKACVILTDLDTEGKKIYSKLNSGLSQHGVHVDNMLRHFLFRKTKIRQIEGICNILK